jgi:hypothetical protein
LSLASTLGLGLRLAVGRGRPGLIRLMLMTAGVALGVALVTGGLGIAPALDARRAREFARIPAFPGTFEGSFEDAPPPADHLLWSPSSDRIGDRGLVRFTVAGVGAAPVPPGLSRLPKEGEKVVSPALARMLSTPLGRIASERIPGRVIGLVGPEGLLHPDELVVYVGARPASLRSEHAYRAIGFGEDSGHRRDPIPLDVKVLIVVGVVGLLVPTLVFVVTSTRLSAASRERRLAAMRLVGATPGQTRLVAAVESGVSAVAGSVLGVLLFFAFRPVVARISLGGYQWFPSDIAPPVGQVLAVLIAAPLLAVLATLVGLRRLMVSPLGVARRARVRRAGPVRLVLLAAGLAGLGLCWMAREAIREGGSSSLLAVGGSFFVVLVGVAAVAPWLGAAAAPLLTLGERGLGALVGARRLQADPTAAGRVVGAMSLLVCAAGVVLALVPPAIERRTTESDIAMDLPPAAVAVEGSTPVDSRSIGRALRSVEGVAAVAPLSALPGAEDPAGGGSPPGGYSIADCAELGEVLATPFARCGPDTAYVRRVDPVPGWLRPGAVISVRLEGGRVVRVRIPPIALRASLPVWLPVILPPDAFPRWVRGRLTAYETVVATDGTAAAVERVRNAVAGLRLEAVVRTPAESRALATSDVRRTTSLVDLGIVVALGIALANLLVVTIDHVNERRRPVAVLAASGVPLGVLRRSIAVEIGLPLLSALALAVATALAVAVLLGAILDESVVLPLARVATLFALVGGAVAVVTALTFPSLARAARPETLQAE